MTTGVVLSVDVERFGDTLTAATLATDLILHVDDVVDFADEDDFAAGPQWLTVGDSAPMQYVSVDDDNDTITLALAVGAVYEAGDPVRMWDAAAGAEVLSHVAWVELDEADADDQPIPAEVRHEEMIYFGIDDLAGLIGARVEIAEDVDEPGVWFVSQVIGRLPVVSQEYVQAPVLSIDLSANQAIPSGGSPTVLSGWDSGPGTVLGYYRRPTFDVTFGVSSVAITVPGGYYVQATVDWGANTSGGRTAILVFSRGGVDVDSTQVVGAPSPETGRTTQQVSRVFVAEGNETVRVEVRQSSGGSLNVLAAATNIQVARFAA